MEHGPVFIVEIGRREKRVFCLDKSIRTLRSMLFHALKVVCLGWLSFTCKRSESMVTFPPFQEDSKEVFCSICRTMHYCTKKGSQAEIGFSL